MTAPLLSGVVSRARATSQRLRRLVGWRSTTLAVVVAIAMCAAWLRFGPLPPGLLEEDVRPAVVVTDRHGAPLYEARSGAGLRGDTLDVPAIPARLAQATVAAEDRRFRWHPGVDPLSMTRAAIRNVRAGRIVEGGSTITQQVAELLLTRRDGVRPRGWRAKLRETVIALRLEHRLTKDEILAHYLNLAPYGNQIQGAARASTAYFGRPVSTLTAAEAAFLAALPQQPSRFNPWRSPERARDRQHRVLAAMARAGYLSTAEEQAARSETLLLVDGRTAARQAADAFVAPHFVQRVLDAHSGQRVRRIQTTLDAALQRDVRGIIEAEREALRRHHAANVAVAVLDNRTGEWLAWEGSGDYFDEQHGGTIDGVITPRQPGSALKPFTYAAAFERGDHPGRVLADVPSQFPTAEPGILYSPRNYDNQFRGPLRARVALAGSENVPAVELASEVGVPAVARLLRRAGLTTLDRNAAHYGLGLTLGNAEVRLDELVAAYAVFARGGEYLPSRAVRAVDGVAPNSPVPVRVVSDRTAFWIADILSDSDARAFIFGQGGSLDFPFTVAAKTGTSQSYFDNWVVGFTRAVTVGVWVGNFDRTPLRGSSGVTGAGPIFHAVMLAAVERMGGALPIGSFDPILAVPPDVRRTELCALSGAIPTDACPTRALEWMPAESRTERCTWHHATDRGLITAWPEPFRDWARDNGLDAGDGVARVAFERNIPAAESSASRGGGRLTIVRPLGGAVFLLDPTLRPEFQALTFSARGGEAPFTWSVNGRTIGTETGNTTIRWPLVRGRHVIRVVDRLGVSAETQIDVR